jgi:2-hydroxy-3-keto-5-methylthiopentenyl-1-phosphate phosphatase
MNNIYDLFDMLDKYIPYNLNEINIIPFIHNIKLEKKQQEFITWLEENNITVNIRKLE